VGQIDTGKYILAKHRLYIDLLQSQTKELYLTRAVDIQPCFNREVISNLSDRSTTSHLSLNAWAEGKIFLSGVASQNDSILDSGSIYSSSHTENVQQRIKSALLNNDLTLLKSHLGDCTNFNNSEQWLEPILMQSINKLSNQALTYLLKTVKIDLNFPEEIGQKTILHEVSISGRTELVKTLLDNGADYTRLDIHNRLPLHYACQWGHVDILKLLITKVDEQGRQAYVDQIDSDNYNALTYSIVAQNIEAVKVLLGQGASLNPKSESVPIPLNLACQKGSDTIVEQLLLNTQVDFIADAEGLYPQHLLAGSKHNSSILRKMMEMGVNMNEIDLLYGWTPLIHAANAGNLEMIDALLNHGVNIDIVDQKGNLAIYYAAWNGHADCLNRLAQYKHSSNSQIVINSKLKEITAEYGQDSIPDLSLPPPFIPLRKYGHNFLDQRKNLVIINFKTTDRSRPAIEIYDDMTHAARLTITSKQSDIIPHNITLPLIEDDKTISFQVEHLDDFSLDFEIYPSFGNHLIAAACVPYRILANNNKSQGKWQVEFLDQRLGPAGSISFTYQIVTPLSKSLDFTNHVPYWKTINQEKSRGSRIESSLKDRYLRLFIQVTNDSFPVLSKTWSASEKTTEYILRLDYREYQSLHDDQGDESLNYLMTQFSSTNPTSTKGLVDAARHLSKSRSIILYDLLEILPVDYNVDIHISYPTLEQMDDFRIYLQRSINQYIDDILDVIHKTRTIEGQKREMIFSSYNPEVCIALNWKQPDCEMTIISLRTND